MSSFRVHNANAYTLYIDYVYENIGIYINCRPGIMDNDKIMSATFYFVNMQLCRYFYLSNLQI